MTKARASGYAQKRNHPIEARIERLGQLNDRRLIANNANDLDELERIAAEYEAHRMTTTAKELLIAIAVLRGHLQTAQA